MTLIASGKPFDAACASNIQEKPHAMLHALRNLTYAFNHMRLIERKIASSTLTFTTSYKSRNVNSFFHVIFCVLMNYFIRDAVLKSIIDWNQILEEAKLIRNKSGDSNLHIRTN